MCFYQGLQSQEFRKDRKPILKPIDTIFIAATLLPQRFNRKNYLNQIFCRMHLQRIIYPVTLYQRFVILRVYLQIKDSIKTRPKQSRKLDES